MIRARLVGFAVLALTFMVGAFGVGYFLGLGLVAAGVGR